MPGIWCSCDMHRSEGSRPASGTASERSSRCLRCIIKRRSRTIHGYSASKQAGELLASSVARFCFSMLVAQRSIGTDLITRAFFFKGSSNYNTRGIASGSLVVPLRGSKCGRNCFDFRLTMLWNSLSPELRSVSSYLLLKGTFQCSCQTILLVIVSSNCFLPTV